MAADVKMLISPREVRELAFAGRVGTGAVCVDEAVINSAQRKFIEPVVGSLYKRLENGDLPELLDGYIKPALAMYVKLQVLPSLAVSMGSMGVVKTKGNNMVPAGVDDIYLVKKQVRSDARALIWRAIDHIEANPGIYPEYDRTENVLNRVSVTSDIIL